MSNRNFPQEIEDQANELARATFDRDDKAQCLEQTTDEITAAVLREADPETGKPRFTNDKAREIEIRRRQRESAEWQMWATKVDDAEMRVKIATAKLERLRGEFSESKIERRERIAAAEATA